MKKLVMMLAVVLLAVNVALATTDIFGTGDNQFTVDFVDIFGSAASSSGAVLFDNGLSNDITNNLYQNSNVEIRDSFLGGITRINVLSGGRINSVAVYENSLINIDGGWIDGYSSNGNQPAIRIYDSSKAYMSSGRVDYRVYAYGNSSVHLSGGTMHDYLVAYENSKIYVSGGTVSGTIRAYNNSVLTFIGKDFVFGGVEVGYGTFDTMGDAYVNAPLSGTTLAGDPISYDLHFRQGTQVVLIPEPITLILFGLGGLLIRKR